MGGSESGSDRYEIPISFAGALFIFYVTRVYHPRQIVKKEKVTIEFTTIFQPIKKVWKEKVQQPVDSIWARKIKSLPFHRVM